ncbi:MAG: hypothetical protein P1V20_09690 [Verrucomicrobiales bacterium]|nr:hypothetical protein [Verrucomicrobiales bacterium]
MRKQLLVSKLPPVMLLVFFASLLPAPEVSAWGGGHDPLNEFAVEQFPEPVREMLSPDLRRKVVEWSHAPDDFTPWEKLTKITIHPEDLAYLHSLGMKHPYSLHAPRGQAANFILLANAFREKAPERVAYWSACLLHTFSDEAAANHDPLVHYITYAFKGGYKMDLSEHGVLDFVEVTRSAEDHAVIESLLADYKPKPLGTDPHDVLVKIMLHGLEANVFLTERGARVARTFARDASATDIADGRKALAELGCYGIRSGVDAIWTAYEFAAAGTSPELTETVQKAYQEQRVAFLDQRPLLHDSAYGDLLDVPANRKGPEVGVILESSQTMNQSYLGFSTKWIMSAAMRLLRDTDTAWRPLDIRSLNPDLVPDAADMPVVMICSGGLRHDPTRRWLRAYAEKGGHILLIGGEHGGLLGGLSNALAEPADANLPVTSKYGCNNTEYIDNLRVQFVNEFADVTGDQPFRFVHNPDTKAGWQKPKCKCAILSADPQVRTLAQLVDGDRVLDIAGISPGEDGKPAHAFIPEYLVSPYLLTDGSSLVDPSRPAFDSVGSEILKVALRLLAPQLISAP